MVISSRCKTGPKEVLGEGKYGILYEVGNYNQLAKILERSLENLNLREEYEKIGYERVKEFDKERVLSEYSEFLKGLLK